MNSPRLDWAVAAYIVAPHPGAAGHPYPRPEGRVLLVRHRALAEWLPVGGATLTDEGPDEALARLVLAESSLGAHVLAERAPVLEQRITPCRRPEAVQIHPIAAGVAHCCLVYYLRCDSDPAGYHVHYSHHEGRWFDRAELAEPRYRLTPTVAHHAGEALRREAALPY